MDEQPLISGNQADDDTIVIDGEESNGGSGEFELMPLAAERVRRPTAEGDGDASFIIVVVCNRYSQPPPPRMPGRTNNMNMRD